MKLMLVMMQPRSAVIAALCDHTCELAGEIKYVASAHVASRHVTPDGDVVCVQRWRARADVPELLRPHLEDGLHDWTLTFERRAGAYACHWRAESAAVQVPGSCQGIIGFAPAIGGRGTRIEVHAEFAAGSEGLRVIFGRLLAQHWRALVAAAARRLEANPPAD
ncbi:MAG: hypothetical protein ACM3PU_15080 [Gemmatimonadota bacterium]